MTTPSLAGIGRDLSRAVRERPLVVAGAGIVGLVGVRMLQQRQAAAAAAEAGAVDPLAGLFPGVDTYGGSIPGSSSVPWFGYPSAGDGSYVAPPASSGGGVIPPATSSPVVPTTPAPVAPIIPSTPAPNLNPTPYPYPVPQPVPTSQFSQETWESMIKAMGVGANRMRSRLAGIIGTERRIADQGTYAELRAFQTRYAAEIAEGNALMARGLDFPDWQPFNPLQPGG